MKVAVIGGGLGGLAAACVLGARGHQVVLFDKNSWAGGKAALLEEGGFRFDMGPTILTVPSVLERIFAEAGRKLADHLDLVRLDPQWRCFFDDGTRIDLLQDIPTMADAMDRFAPSTKAGQGYREFQDLAANLHGISERFFFWKSVEDLFDTMDLKKNFNSATLRDVLALRMGSSVAATIRSKVKDERLAQMLDHFTQYVGSSPYGSPAVLCAIGHMQAAEGVWYPMGGTRAVAEALHDLAADLGCQFRLGEDVTGLRIEQGQVKGVGTASGEMPVDAVVSNMDAIRTYRELVGGDVARHYDRKGFQPACSGVVLYLGLNKRYEHLAHHDFVFSRDPHEEFEYIYGHGLPAPDPTCYIAAPAITDPAVAPPGGEALYVLVHTPYLRPGQDWQQMFPAYRKVILDKLERTAGMTGLADRIVVERHLTPQDIHDRYKVLNGAIYGLASHGKFTGAFKPGNRSRQVRGLYLAGGSAHPGPGMPMVMMSGWIAADALDADARRNSLDRAS
ncbi:MAG TPA: phytoene desaturase family protein [Geminicoccus sp.]|jgi:phytoene desaturase|uniref:phytoene desaturase family protein n=1 Tax=Geminicoccus sp. TaxID=2024832 RepID=UPI002E367955|nr:phytoene desaturase family protein [Geminicoccus sp.]HEX2528886.1 phytoene desaturase family protein [Geminicoccus sp.]